MVTTYKDLGLLENGRKNASSFATNQQPRAICPAEHIYLNLAVEQKWSHLLLFLDPWLCQVTRNTVRALSRRQVEPARLELGKDFRNVLLGCYSPT